MAAIEFRDGEFYDAVIVPERCGFFKNRNGKLYLRVGLKDSEGGQHLYAWWMSGKLVASLGEALPHMGVDVEKIGKVFFKNAADYIQAVPCRFGVTEETYNNETKLKISGLYFGGKGGSGVFGGAESITDEDVTRLHEMFKAPADPFAAPPITDDDVPF